jgi:putative ABC transport system permease protein
MFKSKLKKWLGNAVTVLLLVIGLAVWISLPWIGVLAVAVLVALWLLLTRGGRLALAATRIGVASLPQRWGASSVIVVGIAGVVGVLVAMLAMGEGFQATPNTSIATSTPTTPAMTPPPSCCAAVRRPRPTR